MPSKVFAVCVKISVKFYLNIYDLLQSKNLVYKQGIYYLLLQKPFRGLLPLDNSFETMQFSPKFAFTLGFWFPNMAILALFYTKMKGLEPLSRISEKSSDKGARTNLLI